MLWNADDTAWDTSVLQPIPKFFQTGRVVLGVANVIRYVVQEPYRNHGIHPCCTNKSIPSLQH